MRDMRRKRAAAILGLWALLILPLAVVGQYFDYHAEESPAISWNGVPLLDARMLAAGGVSLLANPPFAASFNPALIPRHGRLKAAVSYSNLSYEAFQYWGINEGVVIAPQPPAERTSLFSGFALCLPFKTWRIAAGWHLAHVLALPDFDYDSFYYRYKGQFKGREDTFYAAAAFPVGKKFDLGVKLAFVTGSRSLEIDEYYKYYRIEGYPADGHILNQRAEEHRLTYLAAGIGAAWRPSPEWTAAAAFVYPIKGAAERSLSRTWDNLYTPPILENHSGSDALFRPAKMSLGVSYNRHGLTLAAETVYTLWSAYRYIYFSEEIARDLRNTVALALGLEYGLYGKKEDFFLRFGYRFDPQPARAAGIDLHFFTAGLGFRFGKTTTDLGFAYCFSANAADQQQHFVVNGTLGIDL